MHYLYFSHDNRRRIIVSTEEDSSGFREYLTATTLLTGKASAAILVIDRPAKLKTQKMCNKEHNCKLTSTLV